MDFPRQPTLQGQLVEVRPLQETDFDDLYVAASDPLTWEQHPASDRYQEPIFRQFFQGAMTSGGALVVVDAADGRVIGSSRFYNFDPEASEIEIGFTFLAHTHWGGRFNGELKQLMLQHAFQYVQSVVFLVGPDNIRSQRAMEKIGGVRDGMRLDATGLESLLYRISR